MSFEKGGKMEKSFETLDEVSAYPIRGIPERGILEEVCKELGIRTKLSPKDGLTPLAHYFPVTKKGKLKGYIRRDLTKPKKKSFSTVGDVDITSDLLGSSECSSTGGIKLFCVEGLYDWPSLWQTLWLRQRNPKQYRPNVVSVLLGASNAADNIGENLDFISRFKEFVVVFDNDKATLQQLKKNELKGRDAVEGVARLLPNLLDVRLSKNDPNEYLAEGDCSELLYKEVMFTAKAYEPEDFFEGVLGEEDLLEPLKEGVVITTLPKTSATLHGIRKGELTAILAPAGVGKTTLMTEIAYPVLLKHRCDMVYAEEDLRKAQQRFVALHCGLPLNEFRLDPQGMIKKRGKEKEYQEALEIINKAAWLDTQAAFGKIDCERLLRRLAWSASRGYDFAFIDHFTMLNYGSKGTVESIDELLLALAQHVTSTGQGVVGVSHITRRNRPAPKDREGNIKYPYWMEVRKEDARGSGAYEQLCFNIICAEPEILENGERGRVRVRIDKNREWSYLGFTDVLRMNSLTGRMEAAADEFNY